MNKIIIDEEEIEIDNDINCLLEKINKLKKIDKNNINEKNYESLMDLINDCFRDINLIKTELSMNYDNNNYNIKINNIIKDLNEIKNNIELNYKNISIKLKINKNDEKEYLNKKINKNNEKEYLNKKINKNKQKLFNKKIFSNFFIKIFIILFLILLILFIKNK